MPGAALLRAAGALPPRRGVGVAVGGGAAAAGWHRAGARAAEEAADWARSGFVDSGFESSMLIGAKLDGSPLRSPLRSYNKLTLGGGAGFESSLMRRAHRVEIGMDGSPQLELVQVSDKMTLSQLHELVLGKFNKGRECLLWLSFEDSQGHRVALDCDAAVGMLFAELDEGRKPKILCVDPTDPWARLGGPQALVSKERWAEVWYCDRPAWDALRSAKRDWEKVPKGLFVGDQQLRVADLRPLSKRADKPRSSWWMRGREPRLPEA